MIKLCATYRERRRESCELEITISSVGNEIFLSVSNDIVLAIVIVIPDPNRSRYYPKLRDDDDDDGNILFFAITLKTSAAKQSFHFPLSREVTGRILAKCKHKTLI